MNFDKKNSMQYFPDYAINMYAFIHNENKWCAARCIHILPKTTVIT